MSANDGNFEHVFVTVRVTDASFDVTCFHEKNHEFCNKLN